MLGENFPIDAFTDMIATASPSTISCRQVGLILTSLAEEGQHEALQICLGNHYLLENITYHGNAPLQAALKKRNTASESDRFRYEVTINILRAIPSVAELERRQIEMLDALTSQMNDLDVAENAGEKRKSSSSESVLPYKKMKEKHTSNGSGEKRKAEEPPAQYKRQRND